MADFKNNIQSTIITHLLIQLTFLLVRIPSLVLSLSTFACFYYFFGLPADTIDPQPTVDTIYLAAYIINNIAFFFATLSDLIALYFALPFRKPFRALSIRHLSTRIRLEKVTSWLLMCSAVVNIYFELQQRATLLAGLPSYETPKSCSRLLAAMLFVRILFVLSIQTLEQLVEDCEKIIRDAKLTESGEELLSC